MTMIERVARALCNHGEADCWRTHVEDARSAIVAMRDPTQVMKNAGADEMDTCDPADWCPGPDEVARGYQAMIDAALADAPGYVRVTEHT